MALQGLNEMIKRIIALGLLALLTSQLAVAQLALEVTAHQENQSAMQRTRVWVRGCEARMEESGGKEKMYMLLKECGKTTIAVSLKDKAALKMPPMQSSPAADLQTGALFMQGRPQISVEKLEEKSGTPILGRGTRYYRFKSVHKPDQRITEPVTLIVEEEFWTDPTLDVPVLEGLLSKMPIGEGQQVARRAFSLMNGLPLRHRTVVTVVRAGSQQVQAPFVQEVVSISTEPFDESLLQIPKDYPLMDLSGTR